MPEPSDPSHAHPINRVVSLFPPNDPLREAFSAAPSGRVGAGFVVNQDGPEGKPEDVVPELSRATTPELDSLAKEIDRASNYSMWYDLVRCELDSGRDREEIRSHFLQIAADFGEGADTLHEAIEDALAERTPRYKNPLGP